MASTWIHRVPQPYVLRHGRCYINDPTLPYPLPCDVPELHRQTLQTRLLSHVFGAPFCAPQLHKKAPRRVLDVACGSGFWSSLCAAHLAERGFRDVEFTGLDIAALPPNLCDQGVNWTFVQHDLRRLPLPFDNASFDLVMLKDLSLVVPSTGLQNRLMEEYLRILSPGGILEVWESDHTLRSFLPQATSTLRISDAERRHADDMAIFPLPPSMPGSLPQNTYLQDLNLWIRKTLELRQLTAAPCTAIAPLMLQEVDKLGEQGSRRLAILLNGAMREGEGAGDDKDGATERHSDSSSSPSSSRDSGGGRQGNGGGRILTPDQAALRSTALLIYVQMIESLEPALQRASGKSHDEWDRWWAGMMEDLLVKGELNGDCLEVGAWWGRKL
ncbi:MAG: hypothetical protein M1832_002226 [Thelocarpon impressellum]|nr:MAG: hypothetical protein M1832_002226 [Thelocarpon impressellum]